MRLKVLLMLLLAAALPVFGARIPGATPATTNNDDSCDIAVMPAATLLLPYFEVDLAAPPGSGTTTIFTVTNVVREPQIVRITIWTNLGWPVYAFNVFLTGYDVQALNLYDILVSGVIAGKGGTSSETTPGPRSLSFGSNPHFRSDAASLCANLPQSIASSILDDVRRALTTGAATACDSMKVAKPRKNATGYLTMDVVASCNIALPIEATYWTDDLLYDNVLIGDDQIVEPERQRASGGPLVHIRAAPEGGLAGERIATALPYTFYDRLTPRGGDRTRDRRQPLPSSFALHWFAPQGSALGFTQVRFWREGRTGPDAGCHVAANDALLSDAVRFDEHENPVTWADVGSVEPLPPITVAAAQAADINDYSIVPPYSSAWDDGGGWLYINASNRGSAEYSVTTDGVSSATPGGRNFYDPALVQGRPRGSQAWVSASLTLGRYAVSIDAAAMSNGCTPIAPFSGYARDSATPIAPGPNATP